jgi:hypothetical protein
VSSSTGASAQDTRSDGSGKEGGSDRKQHLDLLLNFLGTLPGILTAAAALITAIGAAFLGGTQLTSRPQAQPTVFVTVTATASAGPADVSSSGAAPAQSPSAAGSPASTQAPPSGTDLSSLTPVQNSVNNFTTGTEEIGTTNYSDGIRFTCSDPNSGVDINYNSLVYVVAGSKTLNATFGVPDDASNAAGNSATIKFYKDGTSTELGQPITIALDSPQRVSLNLQGSSQLEIYCAAANPDGSDDGDDIDVAIGGATLISS